MPLIPKLDASGTQFAAVLVWVLTLFFAVGELYLVFATQPFAARYKILAQLFSVSLLSVTAVFAPIWLQAKSISGAEAFVLTSIMTLFMSRVLMALYADMVRRMALQLVAQSERDVSAIADADYLVRLFVANERLCLKDDTIAHEVISHLLQHRKECVKAACFCAGSSVAQRVNDQLSLSREYVERYFMHLIRRLADSPTACKSYRKQLALVQLLTYNAEDQRSLQMYHQVISVLRALRHDQKNSHALISVYLRSQRESVRTQLIVFLRSTEGEQEKALMNQLARKYIAFEERRVVVLEDVLQCLDRRIAVYDRL